MTTISDLVGPVGALLAEVGADVRKLATDRLPVAFADGDTMLAEFAAIDGPAADTLRTGLTPLRPGAGWADDEFGEHPAAGEFWVCDAVDGAVQLLHGLPYWCVTVALVRDGAPVFAALHSPLLGETYTAVAGAGAHRDGVPVRPSAKRELGIAMAATSQPPFVGRQPAAVPVAGRSLSAVLPEVLAVRNLGPTSWQVAEVAAGRLDLFWEFGRDATNLLAAALVAREAGAVVTDAHGTAWRPDSASFLAAAPGLHAAAVRLLAAAERAE